MKKIDRVGKINMVLGKADRELLDKLHKKYTEFMRHIGITTRITRSEVVRELMKLGEEKWLDKRGRDLE